MALVKFVLQFFYMEISKKYDSISAENKWYAHWMKHDFFHSEPDEREAYTIVIPPPNVTGVLHMGHMLNNTIQDVLVRRARLLGKNACWVPGTDHASIATEAKVVQKLESEGLSKQEIGREEFLKHAWDWTEKYGGTIFKQLERLGASCDWQRMKFTLDDDLSDAVRDVFIDLFDKGLIYRGIRMVNWDPSAQTAVSDEEVIHKEVNSKLYYIKYKIEDTDDFITIATTRPETLMGDTAVCVHPDDERYFHLKGKKVIVPLVNRSIPIIQDSYIDMEFGTAMLKVTPAHDINDYELGVKHNLASIDVLNDDGTLSEAAEVFVGMDRFKARKEVAKELEKISQLDKVEEIKNSVGYSERTNAIIEPKLSLQWFLKMENLAKPALENVMNDTIQFHPKNTKNTYRHWMENIKDWCVSRQLWWGHRIPAYYYGEGANDYVIATSKEDALEKAKEKTGKEISLNNIKQDEDVLDTWFSSWLWPISVFDGFNNPKGKDIQYYYPTNDLVTAPEIMFFWVARMVMAGYEYLGKPPFKNVYYTGIVRDKQRRKMSKSLGNSPDPVELIEKYSADGVRVGMLFSSPAGNDLLFDESLCEQGRNFSNKIWNALRLVKSWELDESKEADEAATLGGKWFENEFQKRVEEINQSYDQFRMSEALMSTYKLVWDEFCSWYLEMVKPNYGEAISGKTYKEVISHFEQVLRVLNPLMPFITEEIWHSLVNREDSDCLMVNHWPSFANETKDIDFESIKEIIIHLRRVRKEKQISMKDSISLIYSGAYDSQYDKIIEKLANVESICKMNEKPDNFASFIVKEVEFFVPLSGEINSEEEKEKLQKELDYLKGFLKSVEKKLSNERFVNNAPDEVVAVEKKKQAEAVSKIELLENQLSNY